MLNIQSFDSDRVCQIAPALRMLCNNETPGIVKFTPKNDNFSGARLMLNLKDEGNLKADFENYVKANSQKPRVVTVDGLGYFAIADDYTKAAELSRRFEAGESLEGELGEKAKQGRIAGRICIVTGGAQGFGQGIAAGLVEQGAYIVIADLNPEGGAQCASQLNDIYGEGTAISVKVDVSDEQSVEAMVKAAVITYGGLDIMVSNAGINIAGTLEEMTSEKFNLVAAVNYTGYFLCTKYASRPMKIQSSYNPNYWMDIIEINSKSGLTGSNKNFAYAGSKFGGIGLTQSFALELVEHSVKVNAICPGNLLDGPLWSDPDKGLFVQYLEAGKVPGAKTVADVRKHYEAQVPMHRGCQLEDVVCAVLYVVEQKYETGQAIPVTGGQVMLK